MTTVRVRWRRAAAIMVGAGVATALLILAARWAGEPAVEVVTTNPDGTVTVELSDLSDLPAANEELRELGIRAELIGYRPAGSCAPEELPEAGLPAGEIVLPQPAARQNVLTFRPNEIPVDGKLILVATLASGDRTTGLDVPMGNPHPTVWAMLLPAHSGTCVEKPSDQLISPRS